MLKKFVIITVISLATSTSLNVETKEKKADIVIYGGTSGGVMPAVQASRMGKSVILVVASKRLGGFNMDLHNVTRYADEDGHVRNEGDVQNRSGAYKISYRTITPKAAECTNLLVPVLLSALHIAFGSIRMEPVFMSLGQSAASAAALSIDAKTSVQTLDYKTLRRQLVKNGQLSE